jgi:hypothetical protein
VRRKAAIKRKPKVSPHPPESSARCVHTTKNEPAALCSQCLGIEVPRVVGNAQPIPPEAYPSNPKKHKGC